MSSYRPLPPAMIADIDRVLETKRSSCISIYPEAEKLRARWVQENIALEDVVSVIVERCGAHSVAISFDRSAGLDVLAEDGPGGVLRR